jgi:Cu/Ag efflux pump CusA
LVALPAGIYRQFHRGANSETGHYGRFLRFRTENYQHKVEGKEEYDDEVDQFSIWRKEGRSPAMIRSILKQSIQFRFLVIILAGVLMFFGVSQLGEMPVAIYPEFDPPLVEVQTEALGLSAEEMEALITVPLEADLLNGVAWLKQIRSKTVAGMSSILLEFDPGTDPIRARQMVQERLIETFALPNVSNVPTMLQPLSSSRRVMMVSLSSEELSLIDLGVLARWVITPRLMGVPGVANVPIWGLREWQLQVQVDPEHLQERGVTLMQVIETSGEALWVSPLSYLESSTPGTAGWIDTPNQRLSIRHELPISSAEDLMQVPVKGTAYQLSDISNVVEDHQPLIGDAILRDGPGLLLVIEKFPGTNTLEVTRGVEQALHAMAPGLSGIEIDTTVFRPANYIEQSIDNLSTFLLIGAFLLVLALVLFYWDWRAVLVSAVAIPVSVITALVVLYVAGYTFNVMVLTGLMVAIGVIVDDAIIDPENYSRRLRARGRDAGEDAKRDDLVEAAADTRGPIIFALLIMLLAVTPVVLLQGVSGAFFQPLAAAYALAVIASMLVALTVTPALSMAILSDTPVERERSPVVRWFQGGYRRTLERVISAPRLAYIITGLLLILSLAVIPFLETSLLPSLKVSELRIEWTMAPSTSRLEMNRVMNRVLEELQTVPGVQNLGAHVGRAITGDQIGGIHSGEIWVSLDPKGDLDAAAAAIQEVIGGYPGVFREISIFQPDRIGDVLAEDQKDIVARIYGWDFEVLNGKAEEVSAILSGMDGLKDVESETLAVEPQIEIEVDLAAAQRYQIKPGDVRRAATTLLSGLRVGNLYEEQKVFDVMVWGEPDIRRNLTEIQNLLIDTPRGGHVRLGEVAEVRFAATPVVINRDAVSRYTDVTANLDGRSYRSAAAEIENRLQGVALPLEYHIELVDDTVQQAASVQRMLLFSVIAAVGIILLLQACFWSWKLAFITTLSLPAALTGGVLAAVFFGGLVSMGSLFGLLAVLALSLRFSIVLFRHYQYMAQELGEAFGPDLVMAGSAERLKPLLMTAFATGLAVLPLVFAGDIPGLEVIRKTAVVILGGLVTTTLLSLFVLPPLYLRYGKVAESFEIIQPESVEMTAAHD